MAAPTPASEPTSRYTESEWEGLCTLRARYQETRDLFTTAELEHLYSVRWLHETGRVVP